MGEPVVEQGPVGQPGQRVVERLVGQLLLECFAVADVAAVEHHPGDVGVVQQVGGGAFDVAPVAVGADPAHVRQRLPGGQGGGVGDAGLVVGVDQLGQPPAGQLPGGLAEDLFDGAAGETDPPVFVQDGHHVARAFDQGPEMLLGPDGEFQFRGSQLGGARAAQQGEQPGHDQADGDEEDPPADPVAGRLAGPGPHVCR